MMKTYSNNKLTELQLRITVIVPMPELNRTYSSTLHLTAATVTYEADYMYTLCKHNKN